MRKSQIRWGKLGLRGRSMLGTSGSLEQKEVWSSQR